MFLKISRSLQRGTANLDRSKGSKVGVSQNMRIIPKSGVSYTVGKAAEFLFKFDSLQLCSPLTYRDTKCLFKKI